ncbi:hypothetical protein [Streptomyces sp. NRRL S-1824]|uniref:hypothetical protein n=1 Tax=Streptomyces sp. NRRL S-1824 TaxID=1463889 RepID=UPI00068A0466|nr:hypothetical protein [Streptomyces sp. NRRL S-1824]
MNDTEQLPTAAEKAAHTAPRREKRPLPAVPTTEDVRAAAAPGFSPPPLPTVVRNPITDGGLGPGHGLLPITGGPALSGQHSLVGLDGTGWYGEDPDDDVPELQPWPDYNARI